MLELKRYVLDAEDGEIGRCKDFLFDDRNWVVRYMVADTRKWLPGRKVLISPISLGIPDHDEKRFPVKLSINQIRESPPLSEDAPVSRKYESLWFSHFGYHPYWIGAESWGLAYFPDQMFAYKDLKDKVEDILEEAEESHLRSAVEVCGYHVRARDESIGYIEDFLVEERSWIIRYMIVDTRKWLPGRKFLVSRNWAEEIDWPRKRVFIDLSAEDIKSSPPYDPSKPLSREYETELHRHYRRESYFG